MLKKYAISLKPFVLLLSGVVACLYFSSCSSVKKYQADSIQEYESRIQLLISRLESNPKLKATTWSFNVQQENGIDFLIYPNEFLLSDLRNRRTGYALYLSTTKQEKLIIQTIEKCERIHHGVKFQKLRAMPTKRTLSSNLKSFDFYILHLGNNWEELIRISKSLLDSEKGKVNIQINRT